MSNYNYLAPALIMLFAVMRIAVSLLALNAGDKSVLDTRYGYLLAMLGNFGPLFGGALFFFLYREVFCSPLCSGAACSKAFPFSILALLAVLCLIAGGFEGYYYLRLVSAVRRAPDLPRVNITRLFPNHSLQVMGLLYYLFGALAMYTRDSLLLEPPAKTTKKPECVDVSELTADFYKSRRGIDKKKKSTETAKDAEDGTNV